MNPRVAAALLGAAVALAVAAWLFASRGETIPIEPERKDEPLPVPPPPGSGAPAPALAPAAPVTVKSERIEPPPAPPGSSQMDTPDLPPPPTHLPGDPKLRQLPAELRPPPAPRFPISSDGIRSAMQDALPQVRECYDEWLKLNPQLQGNLKVAFRIVADGGTEAVVDQVHLAGDAGMGNLAFEGCVLSVMSGLRFDAPPDGAMNVTYPFAFSN